MITLYRAAYQINPRASQFFGLSTDEKPDDTQNGSIFIEVDTGNKYRFDKENEQWHLQP